jgi:hypothetical protein
MSKPVYPTTCRADWSRLGAGSDTALLLVGVLVQLHGPRPVVLLDCSCCGTFWGLMLGFES